jgi:hypothetical protein
MFVVQMFCCNTLVPVFGFVVVVVVVVFGGGGGGVVGNYGNL